MKKGTAKKSLRGKKAISAKSKSKKAATARAGKSAAASAKGKKSAAIKKTKKTAPANNTKSTAPKPSQSAAGKQPLVTKQPQSKQQAALQHGMFLYTDDAWSQAYFNNNDLHSVERALFG